MADIKIDLDPRKTIDALNDLVLESKNLADKVEESLGKNAVKAIGKLEEAAEKGTAKVSSYFRNLGSRVKEDLKTAFDATGILAGAKFANELASGTKQVFEMERAFDRLNTRLQLTSRQMQEFKKQVGSKIAATGQKLEDVLPGVETAAAKGGVKSPEQLAEIGEALGRAKATTGEETGGLADTVVEILKSQGKAVTGKAFKETLDALQATRVSGAFKTAAEAGTAVKDITQGISPKQLKEMGLGTREMGGLAAQASRAGEGGQAILQHILHMATQAGGKDLVNSIFGANIFKGGKLDPTALTRINKQKFGQYSEQTLASATGTDQAGLSRFVDAFKGDMADFTKVVKGSNETADQFESATDNLASSIDRFKERTKEAAREVGSSISKLGNDILHGSTKEMLSDVKEVAKTAYQNKGQIAAAGLMSAGIGVLAGGGLRGLMKKIPGGGVLSGLAGGQLAKAAGIQPVYVTNASEIAKDTSINSTDSVLDKMGKMATGGGGAMDKLGKFGKIAGAAGLVGTAVGVGAAAGQGVEYVGSGGLESDVKDLFKMAFGPKEQEKAPSFGMPQFGETGAPGVPAGAMSPEQMAAAVAKGTVDANSKIQKKPNYTNPSRMTGTGKGM